MKLRKKYYDGLQVQDVISQCVDDYDAIMRILKKFSELPTADVVEVVRCKDCKYFEADIMGNPLGVCCHDEWVDRQYSIGFSVSEDGYCYRGADMRGET